MKISTVITATIFFHIVVTVSSLNRDFLGISNVTVDSEHDTVSFNLEGNHLTYPLNQYGLPSTKVLNILIDSILKVVLKEVDSKIPVPDIHENFKKKVSFFTIKGSFTAKEGYVSDVKTMVRKGDSVLKRKGDSVNFAVILGLEHLSVFFEKYILQAVKMSLKGKLTVDVKNNAFLLDVVLKKTKDECKLTLNSFKLITFDHIKVSMSGAGPKWLTGKIVNWVVNHFHNKIKAKLERRITTVIEKVISDEQGKLCDLLKG